MLLVEIFDPTFLHKHSQSERCTITQIWILILTVYGNSQMRSIDGPSDGAPKMLWLGNPIQNDTVSQGTNYIILFLVF